MEFVKTYLDPFVFGTLGLMSLIMLTLVIERYIFFARIQLHSYSHKSLLNVDLTKSLSGIASIGANAPYVGLLGTVLGILVAFYDMGSAEKIEAQNIMLGLALALKATATGLLVAIPSILFYNALQRKVTVNLERWQAWRDGVGDE